MVARGGGRQLCRPNGCCSAIDNVIMGYVTQASEQAFARVSTVCPRCELAAARLERMASCTNTSRGKTFSLSHPAAASRGASRAIKRCSVSRSIRMWPDSGIRDAIYLGQAGLFGLWFRSVKLLKSFFSAPFFLSCRPRFVENLSQSALSRGFSVWQSPIWQSKP